MVGQSHYFLDSKKGYNKRIMSITRDIPSVGKILYLPASFFHDTTLLLMSASFYHSVDTVCPVFI